MTIVVVNVITSQSRNRIIHASSTAESVKIPSITEAFGALKDLAVRVKTWCLWLASAMEGMTGLKMLCHKWIFKTQFFTYEIHVIRQVYVFWKKYFFIERQARTSTFMVVMMTAQSETGLP